MYFFSIHLCLDNAAKESPTQFDWHLCIICQEFTDERLQCPGNETHHWKDIGSGYNTVSENLKELSRHGDNTPTLSTYIKHLENLSTVLRKKQGKWHKSYQLRFNSTKLARLRKRVHEGLTEEQVKRKSTRSPKEHHGSPCDGSVKSAGPLCCK